jgi:Kyakuja-Dileera-Zisupton transposase
MIQLCSADIIVCIDACFTQKRNKTKGQGGHRDPPNHHPSSVFMPEADVKAVEDFVESCRSATGSGHHRAQNGSAGDDGYEAGMHVPTSVLNGCNDSFVAADEKREKASTTFFADTGLVALLCRHDRPLWTINMTSAGEKQYYAIALLRRLFEHIPNHTTVGVLYDIGCQLHRSCEKWGFLEEFLSRVTFGISVFHAYGHQWPCQVVYHPRKCRGFGLTDGEGCERFWSSLKKLIPGLRVSGVRVLFFFYAFTSLF